MNNRGQLVLGAFLVLLGLAFLLGSIFNINVWDFCWPIGMIALGVWLVMRPRMVSPGMASDVVLLGDLKRRGAWTARSEEIWLGVGDAELDFTTAEIPLGETRVVIYSFVGDVDVLVPRDVGVSVRASAFLVESDLFGREQDTFLTPVTAETENYAAAEHRLRVEMTAFVADLNVRQV